MHRSWPIVRAQGLRAPALRRGVLFVARGVLLTLASLLVAGVVAGASQAAGLKARDVRIGVHPDSTRFVLELSGETRPSIFGLADPYRIVIDLAEVDFAAITDKIGQGAGEIERIRYGLFRPGTGRVVLDLANPAKVARQFLLAPDGDKPWRLVIDLVRTTRADFLTSMRPTRAKAAAGATRAAAPSARGGNGKGDDRPVIVLDAGHGGVDPGAIAPGGAFEKTVVLAVAKRLRDALEATGRYRVAMTRESDVFVPLRQRVQIARNANADLFLSLHVNTNVRSSVRGFSVYTLSDGASDAEAAALAARENKSDIIGGINLDSYPAEVADILIDFAQTRTNERSVVFARDFMLNEIAQVATTLGNPWRSAGFVVLKSPDVPSVLVELGFFTNPREERLLQRASHQRKLVDAIMRAINAEFVDSRQASR